MAWLRFLREYVSMSQPVVLTDLPSDWTFMCDYVWVVISVWLCVSSYHFCIRHQNVRSSTTTVFFSKSTSSLAKVHLPPPSSVILKADLVCFFWLFIDSGKVESRCLTVSQVKTGHVYTAGLMITYVPTCPVLGSTWHLTGERMRSMWRDDL